VGSVVTDQVETGNVPLNVVVHEFYVLQGSLQPHLGLVFLVPLSSSFASLERFQEHYNCTYGENGCDYNNDKDRHASQIADEEVETVQTLWVLVHACEPRCATVGTKRVGPTCSRVKRVFIFGFVLALIAASG